MPFYLGRRGEDDLILFHTTAIPTKQTHGHLYKAVIGPFQSKVGAGYFARYGKNNPDIRTATDAERLARADPRMEQTIIEESMTDGTLHRARLRCPGSSRIFPNTHHRPAGSKPAGIFSNTRSNLMSHYSEHQRMKPVLDLAHKLDIATNPHHAAIFEAGSGGFQVWATPFDHPSGWSGIAMQSGAFSKPCEYVGSVYWKWEDETIVALEIETSAYALADQKPDEFSQEMNLTLDDNRRTIFNRDADIEWLQEKITWLFAEADVPLLPFKYEQAPLSQIGPYILAHYISNTADEYVVIVSPELDPHEFCKPGYEVAHTLEIWRAGDFPADEILRPDRNFPEAVIEPEVSPLIDHFQILTRKPEDNWLEADFEDRISGLNE